MSKFKVKIVPPSLEKATLVNAGRVEVSIDAFFKFTGETRGEYLCVIQRPSSSETPLRRQACLMGRNQVRGAGDKIGSAVVIMSRAFHDASGFSLRDEVELTVLGKMPTARGVKVVEVVKEEDQNGAEGASRETSPVELADVTHWESALGDYLGWWVSCMMITFVID